MKKIIYLDNNATTQVAPEVIEAMLPYFNSKYANPSSVHFFGQSVSSDLNKARQTIAQYINCEPEEIIFTASGSEADNLCIKGFCEANQEKGKHIVTTVIEHPAIINTYKHLENQGYEVSFVGVDDEGFVSVDEIKKAMRKDTILVSVMHGNNEVGSIQPIEEIAAICQEKGVAFHTDAVQTFTKVPLDVKKMNITMASFAGHKIHAPKGIGFAYVKQETQLVRQNDGGGQERRLRAGTENSAYIVGLAQAIKLCSVEDVEHMRSLQQYLIDSLLQGGKIHLNGPADLDRRVCNNINISTSQVTGEMLLNELSQRGICVSTGSACSSKSTNVSPILLAINCPPEYLHGNIRISLSRYTTEEEINTFIQALDEILESKKQFILREV